MPRPGPRPYECVRRAWHSDRHQPIRGSIIRQIFRVATEAHTPATRKNREWQEKLPRVVLKAEEIMYSKANSEAEYVDPETLWERLNDAVDTIIRRDENETGQFLQPCIEAALVLGCVPVRASRSQRLNNPRMYLGPRFQEPAQPSPPSVPSDQTNPPHRPPPQPLTPSTNQLTGSSPIPLPNTPMLPNTSYIGTPSSSHMPPNFSRPMAPPMATLESTPLLNYGSMYHPLYYGSHFQNPEPQFVFPSSPSLSNVILGTPVGWPSHFTPTRNLLPDEGARVGSEPNQTTIATPVEKNHGKAPEIDCDLSLRLGPSYPSTSSTDGGSSSGHQERNLEFSFFPRHNNAYDQSNMSCNGGFGFQFQQEGEVEGGGNVTSRKRKAGPELCEPEDGSCQWQPQLQPRESGGQIRWRGL